MLLSVFVLERGCVVSKVVQQKIHKPSKASLRCCIFDFISKRIQVAAVRAAFSLHCSSGVVLLFPDVTQAVTTFTWQVTPGGR